MIESKDIVLAISNSGETEELVKIIPNIKLINATLISISGKIDSTLVKNSDCFQIISDIVEADNYNLAPTSSTTSTLVYGDALAVVVSMLRNFSQNDFAFSHPSGSLGKKLLYTVDDVMSKGGEVPFIEASDTLKNVIVELSHKGLGVVLVLNKGNLIGIITDGDLRRALEAERNIYEMRAYDLMTINPEYISSGTLAVNCLNFLLEKNISAVPILSNNNIIGVVRIQDLINEGIFL